MAQQDGLNLPDPDGESDSLLEAFKHCIRHNGPRKQEDWCRAPNPILPGCHSASHLSEVLAGKKHIPPAWLRRVSKDYDPDKLIANAVAKWSGLVVRPARRATDAALVRAMRRVCGRNNGIGAVLLAEIEAEALAEPETDEAAP